MIITNIEFGHAKTTFHARGIKKFLTFFKSHKTITFSHLNSTYLNDNFKDNFMREKVNKMASEANIWNVYALSLTGIKIMVNLY